MKNQIKFFFTVALSVFFLISCASLKESMDALIKDRLDRSLQQYELMAQSLINQPDKLPRTTDIEGKLLTAGSDHWVSGFVPGTLWYLYQYSNDPKMLEYAKKYTARIEKEKYNTSTHDLGFMLYCSFGNGYRLTGDTIYRSIMLMGAESLSKRFNPLIGCIKSWDALSDIWQYPVIIDNMMNLEFLFWASQASGDSKYRDICISHADKTVRVHFRPDYSSYHVVSFDLETGEVEKKNTHQGYADETAWARGQAWGLYGFTVMYRETKDTKYLEQAKNIASFLLHHPNLPADKIPYWDFDAPDIPDALRDASAAAIIASALVELSGYVDTALAKEYLNVAETQIRTLSSPEYFAEKGTNGNFILKHSVGHMPNKSEIDVPLTYADYYYIEALLRYQTLNNQFKNQPKKERTINFDDGSWTSQILNEHPRLFFNKQSFKAIKDRALNEENELFGEMKDRVDALFGQEIEFKNPLLTDGTQNTDHEYGTRAAEAAFVYLVTKDKKYFELSKKILVKLVDYYTLRNEHGLNVHWYAFSRINALAAYDWIYNDLTVKERTEIGTPFFKAIHYMLPSANRKSFIRENTGDYKTGFYGPPCLAWYAGIVFHHAGINDSLANALLLKGYDDYTALLKYRNCCAGDDGGSATAVLGYCMKAYPWAEFIFFHTFNSAVGVDISKEWTYVPKFINYIFWNWLPDNKEFGYGDIDHYTNDFPTCSLHIHLSQMLHFYGKNQHELMAMAKWMQTKVKQEKQAVFPFIRFLLTNTCDNIKPGILSENLPKARHFENMGQIFMRSGSGDDDTYALFTAGGILSQHRHYDNNNFVIFKKGFLALDSGTRPEPGNHLTHYYCRTVAHNCITIRMPGEIMPNYWGGPAANEENLPIPNDGGQNNLLGSEVIAFDENREYVYIASDATKSYHQDKTYMVVRQFVFLPPNCFVVFDRVNATKVEYSKAWLLHTAKEPVVKGNEFYTDHLEGRLFCRTLFPENAKLTKIGGEGKQFWSDGRNWPLPVLTPDDWNYSRARRIPDTHELLGQWRMEITPAKSATDDLFLHLIQVGDLSLESMENSTTLRKDDMVGVKFTYQDKEYEIAFNTKEKIGGKISLNRNNQQILNEDFTESVKPQKDLF